MASSGPIGFGKGPHGAMKTGLWASPAHLTPRSHLNPISPLGFWSGDSVVSEGPARRLGLGSSEGKAAPWPPLDHHVGGAKPSKRIICRPCGAGAHAAAGGSAGATGDHAANTLEASTHDPSSENYSILDNGQLTKSRRSAGGKVTMRAKAEGKDDEYAEAYEKVSM